MFRSLGAFAGASRGCFADCQSPSGLGRLRRAWSEARGVSCRSGFGWPLVPDAARSRACRVSIRVHSLSPPERPARALGPKRPPVCQTTKSGKCSGNRSSAEGKAAYYRQREHTSLAARLKILSGILGAAQSVETERTRKIEHMCQTLSVTLNRGQLVLRLRPDNVVAEAVLRVEQSALRISDCCLAARRPTD